MKSFKIVGLILLILLVLWIVYAFFVNNVENLNYTVIENKDGYEIRQLDDYLVAEVDLSGTIPDGVNNEFQLLFNYISGENQSAEKIRMTAPVIESSKEINNSEKIAMTAPVIVDDNNSFAFVLPSDYTFETVPNPKNDKVKIREVKGAKIVALKFKWYLTEKNIEKNKQKLKNLLERDGIEYNDRLLVAGYNAPFTPPFMTRNEIWAYIK